ncbi:MAG: site-specific DNA-methyltransferase, partial [Asgard group archaeon]|nr:site-specific DNA-methyltransferase [Asgard group archaeon]
VVEFKGDKLEALYYIKSKNLHRRQLTVNQKYDSALKFLEKLLEIGEEKQERTQLVGRGIQKQDVMVSPSEVETIDDTPHDSWEETAKEFKISKDTLSKWKKITEVAREDEEIAVAREKVLQGDSTIASVINEIDQKEREEELQEKAKKPRPLLGRIIHGDFFDKIRKIKDDSIDLLFVYPPDNVSKEDLNSFESRKEFRVFTESWLNLVVPKVKDTGRIYICSSQEHKYLFYSFMQQNSKLFLKFHFGQEIIWHYKKKDKPSNKKLYHYVYKPIFYLYGKNADELNFSPESRGETQNNVWTIAQDNYQKPLELLRRIVLTGSREDDLILDPFAGSGTTGVACEELGRKYILIEKDSEQIEIVKDRIKGRLSE